MRLKSKTAIVTGAARGIGFAVAERFLEEGARVVLADIGEAAGAAAVEALKARGRKLTFVACDVGDAKQVARLVETATAFGGGAIDILVNNAGIVHGADFLTLSEADFDRVLRVNLKGAFLMSQAVARGMVERVKSGAKPGAIVNMASINARVAIPTIVSYCVSKGGVEQLTRATAMALAPHGIRVNAVGPGSIATDMIGRVADDPAKMRALLSRTPLMRLGEASEIAAVVAFLASDDASYVTGETVFADGGRLALNYTVEAPEKGYRRA